MTISTKPTFGTSLRDILKNGNARLNETHMFKDNKILRRDNQHLLVMSQEKQNTQER